MPDYDIGQRFEMDHNQVAVITGISVRDLKSGKKNEKPFDWMDGKFNIEETGPNSCVLLRMASGGPSIEQSFEFDPDLTSEGPAIANPFAFSLEEPLRRPRTGPLELKIREPGTEKAGESLDTARKVFGPASKPPSEHPRPLTNPQINEPSDRGRLLSSIEDRNDLFAKYYRVGYPLVLSRK